MSTNDNNGNGNGKSDKVSEWDDWGKDIDFDEPEILDQDDIPTEDNPNPNPAELN